MTDEEWERQRRRAILSAFQTGRPVFADSDGELKYADGSREQVPVDVGIAKKPLPRVTVLAVRNERASHWAFVTSIIAVLASTVWSLWDQWRLIFVAAFIGCAFTWRRVNQRQRAVSRAAMRYAHAVEESRRDPQE